MAAHSIDTIKAWAERQIAEGLPAGLDNYGRVHDVCLACLGRGHQQRMPVGTCPRCHGTGKYAPRIQDQR